LNYNVVTSAVEETISDSLGKGHPHKCIHRKMKYDLRDDDWYVKHPIANGVSINEATRAALGPLAATIVAVPFLAWSTASNTDMPPGWTSNSISSSDELRLKEDVIERARGLKADVLLNLVEANQIWPSIQSISMSLPSMAYHWNSLRKVIRTASGAFLAWKFGVSPILSDMMSVHRYLPRMRDDIQRHADGDKSTFSSKGLLTLVFSYAPTDGGSRYAQGRHTGAPVVRYVLSVKPNQKYITPFFQKADLFLRRFATSPASLLWEKIPFSFVVDWFVDLRGALRAADSLVGFSPYEVVSFTRSLSYHVETDAFLTYVSPCNATVKILDVRIGTFEYKHYERILVDMGASAPTWSPRFGKNQAGISAALISQQLSKL
jgi:hypothetical protein